MIWLILILLAEVNSEIVRRANYPVLNFTICSKQTLVFPKYTHAVTFLSDVSLSEIVMPLYGEILLDDQEIVFGPDKDQDCIESKVDYVDRGSNRWSDPGFWASPRFNNATPDAERMPCYDDTVVFTENDIMDLELPDMDQFVSQFILNNYSVRHNGMINLIFSNRNEEQTFGMNSYGDVGLKISKPCSSPAGCPCQPFPLDVNCSLKKCPELSCAYPVKPLGSCCEICGGVLSFTINTNEFVLEEFKHLVEDTVKVYGDKLVYHIGRLPNMVQLVVVETEDFDGTSSVVTSLIGRLIKPSWTRGYSETLVSGSSLANEGLGSKIMVSMFFAVLFVMGGIYVYYYNMPSVQFPFLSRDGSFGHIRFQSRTDSVVTLARRNSCADDAPVDTSFKNPMFDFQGDQAKPNEEPKAVDPDEGLVY